MSEVSKRARYILSVLIAFALLFIAAANFTPVVIILGIVSLVFFVYILSWSVGNRGNSEGHPQNAPVPEGAPLPEQKKISLSSLIVLILSVVLLLGGSGISGFVSKFLKVETAEVRPNFETTMDLAVSAWKQNFAFGVGPNRFAEFWSLHKPLDINQTQFWNADFYSGSGFIPTIAITTGLLGLLALLVFLALYVKTGVKAIFAQANSNHSRYFATSTFLVSIYFWIILFLYTPNIAVMALAFIFTGLFTATLAPQGIVGLWRVNIFSNPKTNFLSVLSIVLLLIVSVAGGYYVWERSIASIVFQKGAIEYQRSGDIGKAKEMMVRSLNLAQSDAYWRGLAELLLQDFGRVLSGITDAGKMTEAVRAEAQNLIANSVEAAKKATEADNGNFQNWFALGRVYEVLAGNGIEGSQDSARAAYAEAALRSPSNPAVPLALARLDALSGDVEGARTNLAKAIELKNNYTDAYYTLAQLEAASNNIPAAIRSVEAATVMDPTNSGLYFHLGVLKYNVRDFAGAAASLERAVALVPDYANARYFLGLSYYEIGKKAEAVKQFEELQKSNPDNKDVSAILTNLKAGKAPIPNVTTASKTKPPVEE